MKSARAIRREIFAYKRASPQMSALTIADKVGLPLEKVKAILARLKDKEYKK